MYPCILETTLDFGKFEKIRNLPKSGCFKQYSIKYENCSMDFDYNFSSVNTLSDCRIWTM